MCVEEIDTGKDGTKVENKGMKSEGVVGRAREEGKEGEVPLPLCVEG